jgi:membrane-associated phospholipid phosphatase
MFNILVCLSKHYDSLFFSYLFIGLSNSLFAFCVSGLVYMIWWKYKPFVVPLLTISLVGLLCTLIKYGYGEKVSQLTETCCLSPVYGFTNFTFPSTHAGIVFVLGVYYIKPFIKARQQLPVNDLLIDPNSFHVGSLNVNGMGKWEKLIRAACIFFYVILVCLSRIYLLTNDFIDVLAGLGIGVMVSIGEYYLTQFLEPQISTMKTE